MDLRAKLLRAGALTAGSYSVELITRLLSNLILTRLLFPEAFGLMAASTSLLVGLSLVSDFGIRAIVIQSPRGASESFLHAAWVFQITRGIILWLILVTCSVALSVPAIHDLIPKESVFSNKAFPMLTIILGLGLLLTSLESTAIPLSARKLNYRPIVVLDLVGKITPVPIMIGCAVLFPSVWALALGTVVGSVIRAALSHMIIPGPRMAWKWQATHVQEILHFGKWITVSSVATFFAVQSDVILFGLLFPSAFVGVYFIARTLIDAVEGLLEKLNGSLTLPVVGEVLRRDPENLQSRFYRFRLPIDIVAFTCGGMLFEIGERIIGMLYDPRYAEAGPILQLFGLGLAMYPFQLIRSAFTAIAKTRIVALVSILQAVALVCCLLAGNFLFGARGAVIGIVLSRIIPSVLTMWLAHRYKWISVRHELRAVPLFVLGVIMGRLFLLLPSSFW